jgi:hypothetical protein
MHLASAGIIDGDASALRQAQLMFAAGAAPWCSTEF